ncbi:MAG: inositol monophosphatase, partial [Nitrospiraceae bacterium]
MRTESLPPREVLESLKTTAVEAAKIAGHVLLQYARTGFHIEYKNIVNLVTDADRRSEQVIIETIAKHYPDHHTLAEERGLESIGDSPYRWVIDPLDGTTNFAHGYPAYCVSIGLEYQARVILGVVWDPTRQELFIAEAGRGASLNGTPLRVSGIPSLDSALLVTGFAYDIRETTHNNL